MKFSSLYIFEPLDFGSIPASIIKSILLPNLSIINAGSFNGSLAVSLTEVVVIGKGFKLST
ncbi:MAG: hypothetical protein Ct9H90mP20_4760 [Candidatus Neomarinimicrobiota bacterium]|nr:MAG: hypothetical protein Ct9H90mP20_4760 [Candidatus Neomarinimicrobiota bacterium]